MPTKKLTALTIAGLPQGDWHDLALPGLILRVGVNRRTWSYRYHAGGSFQRKPLGHWPAVSLSAARDAARGLIGLVDAGLPVEAPARIRARRTASPSAA